MKFLRILLSKILVIIIGVPTIIVILTLASIEIATKYLNRACLDFLHDIYVLTDKIHGGRS
jgi:hypothetical protein